MLLLCKSKVSGSILIVSRPYSAKMKTKSSQILSLNNSVYYLDAHNKIGQFRYTIVAVTLACKKMSSHGAVTL